MRQRPDLTSYATHVIALITLVKGTLCKASAAENVHCGVPYMTNMLNRRLILAAI